MSLSLFFGILLIAIGAFSSGSFAVPFNRIKGWSWETYWMVFSLGAYIIFPAIASLLFANNFVSILQSTSESTLITVFLLGALYGVGNLSFGLALRYLGLSLGYALALGLMLAIGTLIPPSLDGRLSEMMQGTGGSYLIVGILVAIIGIGLSAWAGWIKDQKVSKSDKNESISEFNLTKGIIAALVVGFTGSAMALGFEQGAPIANEAIRQGVDPLFVMMPIVVVLFSGTFVTTIFWCGYLGWKSKSLRQYQKASSPSLLTKNYLFALLAGFLWFSQFIVYGMGKSKMGHYTFVAWGILMALTIVFATLWGFIRKEWKGAPTRSYWLIALAMVIITLSSFLIGISGSL